MNRLGCATLMLALFRPALAAQEPAAPPAILSSLPLSQEIEFLSGFSDLRVGCMADGTFLMPLVKGTEKAATPLVKVTPAGAVVARFDVENPTGLGSVIVMDFAPGPDGETYALVRRVLEEQSIRNQDGSLRSVERRLDDVIWLLRFDQRGDFVAKQELQGVEKATFASLAVLPSRDFMVFASSLTYLPRSKGAPLRRKSTSEVFLFRKGGGAERVEWPEPQEGYLYRVSRLDEPMVIKDEVWVARLGLEGAPSFLRVLRPNGTVVRQVTIEIPPDVTPVMPRIWGKRLMVALHPNRQKVIRGSRFAEFDAETGKLLADYLFPSTGIDPICFSDGGALFMNGPKGLLQVVDSSQ